MKYPLITAYFAGARHGFEIKTGILTVSWRERTNSELLHYDVKSQRNDELKTALSLHCLRCIWLRCTKKRFLQLTNNAKSHKQSEIKTVK